MRILPLVRQVLEAEESVRIRAGNDAGASSSASASRKKWQPKSKP
jgi:hypothetical protein